ncbi:uncharacterized protein SPSK_10163 [Sporothrix schenckii 1099-18]|uniref:Uncharacterized protein n=1 Tax=Sporothrix schenckii 1099-18 TaxID=1397361 RepID=A0A0F2MA45_SPOSC|nr:uncharacterized protein SPSK_10163 [Sporothrix schenckii 1099-18]KJR85705.1 hypothetical protein SPSK_10163 [Sporothrix schenckii 1099-18]
MDAVEELGRDGDERDERDARCWPCEAFVTDEVATLALRALPDVLRTLRIDWRDIGGGGSRPKKTRMWWWRWVGDEKGKRVGRGVGG